VSRAAWFAIEAVVGAGLLWWIWRLIWALERSGEATPLAKQRARIGFLFVVLLLIARAAWGYLPLP
jgi:hypothetical protein